MPTPQVDARRAVEHFEYLSKLELRMYLYKQIEFLREESYNENEIVRPQLRAGIEKFGRMLSEQRDVGCTEELDAALVEQIQSLNHLRHDNRERVKTIAYQQSVNKAMLAEVSRWISLYEETDENGLRFEGDEFQFVAEVLSQ